jgi:acetyl esterase/lipase
MPQRNLQITIHEWSAEEKKANDNFYSILTQAWNQMTPWYKTEPVRSAAGVQRVRDAMRFGRDGWPAKTYLNDIAQNVSIPSRSGNNGLFVRVLQNPNTEASHKGVYMHMHAGGWTLGAADGEDEILYRIAKNTGYVVASVEYRLAPEHPYPAPIDDCIDAALHLLSPEFESKYGPLRVIGGESAGAHLTMTVTLALRDLGYNVRAQLDAIVLNYGCYGKKCLKSNSLPPD